MVGMNVLISSFTIQLIAHTVSITVIWLMFGCRVLKQLKTMFVSTFVAMWAMHYLMISMLVFLLS